MKTTKKRKDDDDDVDSGSGSDEMSVVKGGEAAEALKEAEEASKAAESAVSAVSTAAVAATPQTARAARLLLEKIHPDTVHAADLRYLSTLREMLLSFEEEARLFLSDEYTSGVTFQYICWEIEETTNSDDPRQSPVSVVRPPPAGGQISGHSAPLSQDPVRLVYKFKDEDSFDPMINGAGDNQLLSQSSGDEQGGGRRRPVKKSTHRKPRRHTRNYQSRNKHKRSSSSSKTTIKHRKSYRKHNRTIKRRKSRRHR